MQNQGKAIVNSGAFYLQNKSAEYQLEIIAAYNVLLQLLDIL